MNKIRCYTFNSNCSFCHKNINFSDSIQDCNVKNFTCDDFNLILMKVNDRYNNFKLKITIICNRCLKVQLFDFNIGKRIGQIIKTDDDFTYQCCNQTLSGFAFLTEEELSSHGQSSNSHNNHNNVNANAGNNNQISNNDNSINIINDNQNNIQEFLEEENFDDNNDLNNDIEFMREIEEFEKNNIIEFRKKDLLLNFLDDETNKLYKIYTKSDLKLESVLEDLVSQFPELSYKNKRILINNNNANLSSKIKSFNLNAQSNIIIK